MRGGEFHRVVLADRDVEVDIAGDRTPGVATEVLFATCGFDALPLRAALTSVRALHSRASSACSREAPAISFITTMGSMPSMSVSDFDSLL